MNNHYFKLWIIVGELFASTCSASTIPLWPQTPQLTWGWTLIVKFGNIANLYLVNMNSVMIAKVTLLWVMMSQQRLCCTREMERSFPSTSQNSAQTVGVGRDSRNTSTVTRRCWPGAPPCRAPSTWRPRCLSSWVTTERRNKLWTYRQKSQGYGLKLPNASIFTVESVLNARKNKNKIEFLVKFAGFPFQEACWEPVTSLPTFIVEHYSVKTNLGTPLPTPTVKKTVKNGSGTEIFQHLEWKTNGLDKRGSKTS